MTIQLEMIYEPFQHVLNSWLGSPANFTSISMYLSLYQFRKVNLMSVVKSQSGHHVNTLIFILAETK
uniref:Putative ovule protein n=1 Tax=Solanum chacoense TaxID=4108 RepID=A0A0V0ILG4_SOLCH